MDFGIASVAAITVICYLVGLIVKSSGLDNKYIPAIVGLCGGVLGVAALFFLEPYWVVSADGAQLRLPWSQQTPAPSAEPIPFSSSPVVVVTPEIQTPAYLHAAFLPDEALYDGSAAARLTEAGAEAALFDMKTDEGLLHYRSELPLADQAGVNPKDTALNAAILALNGTDGLYTVARVSCFRDNSLPKARNDMAVRSPAGNWRDNGGYRWLSPSSSDAQGYLIDICLELAGLGFDEILLDNAGYPVDGNLDYIVRNDAYDSALFPATVRGFYTDLVQRLEEQYPEVVLSVVTDRDTLEAATSEESGQTLSGMAERMDRIWVRDLGAAWTQCVQLLDEAGLSRPEVNLVSIDTQAGVSDRSWCLWP